LAHVDKRSITLSPDLAAIVDHVVEAGEYASASEVIRDALRLWRERRELFGYTVEELRTIWEDGTANGTLRPGAPLVERMRQKYAAVVRAAG
jgi:antitoxin ParD1/3/4